MGTGEGCDNCGCKCDRSKLSVIHEESGTEDEFFSCDSQQNDMVEGIGRAEQHQKCEYHSPGRKVNSEVARSCLTNDVKKNQVGLDRTNHKTFLGNDPGEESSAPFSPIITSAWKTLENSGQQYSVQGSPFPLKRMVLKSSPKNDTGKWNSGFLVAEGASNCLSPDYTKMHGDSSPTNCRCEMKAHEKAKQKKEAVKRKLLDDRDMILVEEAKIALEQRRMDLYLKKLKIFDVERKLGLPRSEFTKDIKECDAKPAVTLANGSKSSVA